MLASQMLLRDYGGRVPDTMEELLKLPGVGRKTANLILGDVYHTPGWWWRILTASAFPAFWA